MKIAFAAEENKGIDSMLSHHFGRCPYYVFVIIENKNIEEVKTKGNPFFNNHGPGVVPRFIAKEKVDVIVAGGMGPRAITWFEKLGIKAITTPARKIKDILSDYLGGKLSGALPCNKQR